MNDSTKREVERRKVRGHGPKTVACINAELAAIGYKLDRRLDCKSANRYLSGEFAGQSYDAINAYVVEADTGLSFAHVNARRDENFQTLQRIRFNQELYAVVRGRILEL